MVDFKKLGDRAKDLIEKRGGTDALKEDAAELKDIAKGRGSIKDKAKAAAAAIKDEGAAGEEKPATADKPAETGRPKSAGEPEAPTGP
jgi:hypothetical protein